MWIQNWLIGNSFILFWHQTIDCEKINRLCCSSLAHSSFFSLAFFETKFETLNFFNKKKIMSDHHHQKKSDSSSTITNENPELQNLMKDNVQITFSSIKNLVSVCIVNYCFHEMIFFSFALFIFRIHSKLIIKKNLYFYWMLLII